ncbi:MAG: hypothetical protein ABIR62_12960 [Dokdonella sp.]|uniref:hypothetical protein n=1 Tax=Dokdonella sp. TaxID=2291710 RepID=UPI00326561C1
MRAGLIRSTASDRPGVAQPVPERDVPRQPWSAIVVATLLLSALLIGAWELHWRRVGAQPGYRNSNGEWADQRRRIDEGEGARTVLIGSSRTLFDIQLDEWERVTGERPIQLALEGTSALPALEDLAADPQFTGRLLIGIAPQQFFAAFANRADAVAYYHRQTPAQRSGDWLSKHLIEPWFAFFDPDFALGTVVRRQAWPRRPGLRSLPDVRKNSVQGEDRNTRLWSKVADDAAYRAIVRDRWAQMFEGPLPKMDTPAKSAAVIAEQIRRTAVAVDTLRTRGVAVLFVRDPSGGPFLDFEETRLPRATTWDVLLGETGAPGIHFADYAELQGNELPDWSHVSPKDADRYTHALASIVQRDFWPRTEMPAGSAQSAK